MKYGNVWRIQGFLSASPSINCGPTEVTTDLKVGFDHLGIRYIKLNTSERSNLIAGSDSGEAFEEVHGKRLLCVVSKLTKSKIIMSELTLIISV